MTAHCEKVDINFRQSTCFCKGEQNVMYHGRRICVGPATNDKHLIIRWELETEKRRLGQVSKLTYLLEEGHKEAMWPVLTPYTGSNLQFIENHYFKV